MLTVSGRLCYFSKVRFLGLLHDAVAVGPSQVGQFYCIALNFSKPTFQLTQLTRVARSLGNSRTSCFSIHVLY